jgi:hypothetical protein
MRGTSRTVTHNLTLRQAQTGDEVSA